MRSSRIALVPILLLAVASPAGAVVAGFDYSGVITSVYDGNTGAPITFADFHVGDSFSGCFSYDTESPDALADPQVSQHQAPGDKWTYDSPAFSMTATDVYSGAALFPWAEDVFSSGQTPTLPPGWSAPDTLSNSFSVVFQNAPSLGVVLTDALPTVINLSDWVNTRQLRLDFFDGVTSPSDSYPGRLIVEGEIFSVGPAAPGSACLGADEDPVERVCPSDSATWRNHGAYVSCVAHATQDLVHDGTLTREERQARVDAAAHSDIGK